MGLTGLQIFKLLPKTNCGECDFPTCMAFAMALAQGKTSLDMCPYVSDEAKEQLESAAAPPIKKVTVGTGEFARAIGDETEIFRHDKRFFNETILAIEVKDTDDVDAKCENFNDLKFERIGMEFVIDAVAVVNDSGDADKFKSAVETAVNKTERCLVLMSEDADAMAKALEVAADRKPLIYAATNDNYEKMVELAKEKGCPLAVRGNGLMDTAELVDKVVAAGHKDLVIDPGSREMSQTLADLTQIRRAALRRVRTFGYPSMAVTTKEDPMEENSEATVYMANYAQLIVMKTDEKAALLPLVSWRLNLYTDPQKPIAVESGLYEVGEVTPDSPVYVTTNFSLTYFIVEGEVEGSKIPSYIISVDTDGISVLTAWADNKFSGEIIAKYIKDLGLEEKVNHKKIVIPGGVAVIKGKLEDESGWEVIVGPREASGLPKFARENFGK